MVVHYLFGEIFSVQKLELDFNNYLARKNMSR